LHYTEDATYLFVSGVEGKEIVAVLAFVLGLVVDHELVGTTSDDNVVWVAVAFACSCEAFYAVVVCLVAWAGVNRVFWETLLP
jgi:hypothetical protein